jgi:hypothetical protein
MQVQSDVRRLDLGAVWASTMEALNKQKAEPPTIDMTAAEPAPELKEDAEPPMTALEHLQTEPPPDDVPEEW